MDRFLNAMKCAICHDIIESAVILPCSCNICNKHVSNQTNGVIMCQKCGIEHQIPINGFQLNSVLQEIKETKIANLDFGRFHKEAKNSCESLENALKEIEVLLKDPFFYTHERITELKNSVQLKGEELKLIIDQEMKKLFDRLEDYQRQSKEYLSSNEFKEESKRLESEMEIAQSNLDSWLENLNEFKIDEKKWKGIKRESEQKLKCITEQLDKLKNKLLLNNFDENQNHVNWFKKIKIDSLFEYVYRDFLVSNIINESLAKKLEDLLKKKELNDRKWSLLYQGSRDGFLASDFHSRCDHKPNTLTIVKSNIGNIFGGFTSAHWNSSGSWQEDKSSFLYSLINKENRHLIFEHSSNNKMSICLNKQYGPVFGAGNDICIYNSSNSNTSSFSNLGNTYTHPDYPLDSEKAKTILAGTEYFQVVEIEVYQLQQ